MYSEQMTSNLMRVEAEYQQGANLEKIASQNEVILLKEEMIGRKETITWLTIGLAIASMGFGLPAFRSYKINRRANKLLDRKVRERTEELQTSNVTLTKMYLDVSIAEKRKSHVINETVERIKGLCRMALCPAPDPVREAYIKEIERNSGKLLQRLPGRERRQDVETE